MDCSRTRRIPKVYSGFCQFIRWLRVASASRLAGLPAKTCDLRHVPVTKGLITSLHAQTEYRTDFAAPADPGRVAGWRLSDRRQGGRRKGGSKTAPGEKW